MIFISTKDSLFLVPKANSATNNHDNEICAISETRVTPYNTTKLDALISQIYFWNKTLHVSDSYSLHRQEFFTVHTAMLYVI